MAVAPKIKGIAGAEAAIVLALTPVVYILGVIVYRLYFHPLANYPGPFLAKITSLHALYHAYIGDRHVMTYRAHEKYGSFVRLSPNLVSANTKEALKEIYGVNKNVQKAQFFVASSGHASGYALDTSTIIDKPAHARKRRILAHAFTETALRSMEQYMLPHINTLCNIIANGQQSIPFEGVEKGKWRGDMSEWANWLTFDIMGELSFGRDFRMLTTGENRYVPKILGKSIHRGLICGTMPLIDKWQLDTWFLRSIAEGQRAFWNYAKKRAQERMALTADRKDFFHYLLNAKDPEGGSPYSMDELWAESRILMIAGSETTAATIAGCFFYLTRNPAVLAKLKSEIHSTFTTLDEIRLGRKLSSLTYLKACIEETLRLSPSAPGVLPREVLPGGLTIGSHFFPAGVEIGMSSYTLHRNPLYFSDPHTFRPERWLPDLLGENDGAGESLFSAFAPFSIGSRGCIGKRLAYMEMELALSKLLWAFDPTYVSGGIDKRVDEAEEYMLWDHLAAACEGPVVEFQKREGVTI